MSTNAELEILLKRAINLLHSSEANSAQELRFMLDEEIQKRYGSERILSNTLRKKHLEAEANFPGRAVTPPPPKPPTESEIINLINSPAKTISDSPDTIIDSDDAVSGQITDSGLIGDPQVTETVTVTEDETNLKEFGDLNCCVCAEMMFTATNRLIECVKCGALYHQECHRPAIKDDEITDEQAHNWQCDNCLNKPTTSKAAGIIVVSDEPTMMPLAASTVAAGATGSSITSISKSKSSATSSRSSSSNSSSSFYKGDYGSLKSGTTNSAAGNNTTKTRDDKYISGSTTKPSVSATSVITTATESNVHPHTQNVSNAANSTSPSTSAASSSKRSSSHSHSSSSSSSNNNKMKSRHHDNKKKSSK